MLQASNFSASKVFVEVDDGEFIKFDMTLTIQMLFNDIFNFVSRTDFEN